METYFRIILFIFLFFSSFISKQNVICECQNNINYCILEKYEKGKLYYIISFSNCNSGKILDTLVGYNFIHYQYYAKEDIKLIIEKDTFIPESYIFEDNISGAIPYYKQIVGYNIPKESRKQSKKIIIKNFNLINEINLKP
jgi:hypothetical protein